METYFFDFLTVKTFCNGVQSSLVLKDFFHAMDTVNHISDF